MTRPSERELRNTVESFDKTDDDAPERIIIKTTIVGTEWDGGDSELAALDPGETRTRKKVLELSGADA
jgi:hypothetical protein